MAGLSLQDQLAAYLNTPETMQEGTTPNIVPTTMGGAPLAGAASADVTTAAVAAPPPVTAPAPGFMDQLRTYLQPKNAPMAVPPELASSLSPEEQAQVTDTKDVDQAQYLKRLAWLGTILTGGLAAPLGIGASINETQVRNKKQDLLDRAMETAKGTSEIGVRKGQRAQTEAAAEHSIAEADKAKEETAHAAEKRSNDLTIAQAHKLSAEASMKAAEAAMKNANQAEAIAALKNTAAEFKTTENIAANIGARIYGLAPGGATKEEQAYFKWHSETKAKFDIMQGLSQGGTGGLAGLSGVSVPPLPAFPTGKTAPAASGGGGSALKVNKIRVQGPAGQTGTANAGAALPPGWIVVQ